MTTQPEIKAGQRWAGKLDGRVIATIHFVDDEYVLYITSDTINGCHAHACSICIFLDYFKPALSPFKQTRHVTADDVMKMLAVNPVVFALDERNTIGWFQITAPHMWLGNNSMESSRWQLSHNPFAPNPVIVGPEVEVTE